MELFRGKKDDLHMNDFQLPCLPEGKSQENTVFIGEIPQNDHSVSIPMWDKSNNSWNLSVFVVDLLAIVGIQKKYFNHINKRNPRWETPKSTIGNKNPIIGMIWRFPKMGVPPVIIHFERWNFPSKKPSSELGYPHGHENPLSPITKHH